MLTKPLCLGSILEASIRTKYPDLLLKDKQMKLKFNSQLSISHITNQNGKRLLLLSDLPHLHPQTDPNTSLPLSPPLRTT